MMTLQRRSLALLPFLLWGCATSTVFSPPFVASDACLVGPAGPRVAIDSTITVAIDAVPPTILFPVSIVPGANAPAEFVTRRTSETLVRVDCQGHVIPGLASSWTADSTRRRWFLHLRRGAHFADGSRATPKAVTELLAGRAGDGFLVPWAGLRMAQPSGDTGLVLVFDEPVEDLRALASPALALQGWPKGPGSSAVEVVYDAEGALLLSRSAPAVRVRFGGEDGKDAVDTKADLIVSADSTVVAYGAETGRYATVPLPWETTYLIVIPTGTGEVPSPLRGLGDEIAGSVRVSSRVAEGPSWWSDPLSCSLPAAARASGISPTAEIVYPADDPTAKDIAERLVALAGVDDGWTAAMRARTSAGVLAMGVDRGDYVRRMRAGRDAAYVLALPTTTLAPCLLLRSVHSLAPWLRPNRHGWVGAVPVIETRSFALLSRRLAGRVAMDWGGALRLGLSER